MLNSSGFPSWTRPQWPRSLCSRPASVNEAQELHGQLVKAALGRLDHLWGDILNGAVAAKVVVPLKMVHQGVEAVVVQGDVVLKLPEEQEHPEILDLKA